MQLSFCLHTRADCELFASSSLCGAPLGGFVRWQALVLLVIGTFLGEFRVAAGTNSIPVPATRVALTNLLAHKQEYRGKRVEVTGYYIAGFEWSKLSQVAGAPDKESLWIWVYHVKPEPGAKVTEVEKGNVRVIGIFDYNELGSGHLNQYGGEIRKVELFEPLK